jgi:hypothetical protein
MSVYEFEKERGFVEPLGGFEFGERFVDPLIGNAAAIGAKL